MRLGVRESNATAAGSQEQYARAFRSSVRNKCNAQNVKETQYFRSTPTTRP